MVETRYTSDTSNNFAEKDSLTHGVIAVDSHSPTPPEFTPDGKRILRPEDAPDKTAYAFSTKKKCKLAIIVVIL